MDNWSKVERFIGGRSNYLTMTLELDSTIKGGKSLLRRDER